jgi:hypothetical protein
MIGKVRPTEHKDLPTGNVLFQSTAFYLSGHHLVNLEPRTELHLVAGDFLRATVYKGPLPTSAPCAQLFLLHSSFPTHLHPLLLLDQNFNSLMADIEKHEHEYPRRSCDIANPVPLYVARSIYVVLKPIRPRG